MRILLQERLSEDFWMGIMGRKEGGNNKQNAWQIENGDNGNKTKNTVTLVGELSNYRYNFQEDQPCN